MIVAGPAVFEGTGNCPHSPLDFVSLGSEDNVFVAGALRVWTTHMKVVLVLEKAWVEGYTLAFEGRVADLCWLQHRIDSRLQYGLVTVEDMMLADSVPSQPVGLIGAHFDMVDRPGEHSLELVGSNGSLDCVKRHTVAELVELLVLDVDMQAYHMNLDDKVPVQVAVVEMELVQSMAASANYSRAVGLESAVRTMPALLPVGVHTGYRIMNWSWVAALILAAQCEK